MVAIIDPSLSFWFIAIERVGNGTVRFRVREELKEEALRTNRVQPFHHFKFMLSSLQNSSVLTDTAPSGLKMGQRLYRLGSRYMKEND